MHTATTRLALALAVFAVAPNPGKAQLPPREQVLVDASWLARHLHDRDLVILHVGFSGYDQEHISGARLVEFQAEMAGMPPEAQLREQIQRYGIGARPLRSRCTMREAT